MKNSITNPSIHKQWKFIKYTVINPDSSQGLHFGSSDTLESLDLTNSSVAKFFIAHKQQPELIHYKITDSVVIMKGKEQDIKYKIWKLTQNELELVIVVDEKKSNDNLIAMVFKEK